MKNMYKSFQCNVGIVIYEPRDRGQACVSYVMSPAAVGIVWEDGTQYMLNVYRLYLTR